MRRPMVLLMSSALALGSAGSLALAGPVLAAVCVGSGPSLGDGGFETPVVPANTFTLFPAASVPPWQTTDSAGEIEIWGTGFGGVPAAEGNAFAELNANSAGTLYQDVVSTPGATMTWTLQHRGRGGDDVMQVLIGDANVADVNGNTGWDYTSPDLTDGVSAWGTHTATFVVPAGQTCTRFAFRAVSTGSGSPSVGNFLDAVDFSISIPPGPTPTPTPKPTARVTTPPTATMPSPSSGDDGPSANVAIVLVAALVGWCLLPWRRPQNGSSGRRRDGG
jgi:hypothetical protein